MKEKTLSFVSLFAGLLVFLINNLYADDALVIDEDFRVGIGTSWPSGRFMSIQER